MRYVLLYFIDYGGYFAPKGFNTIEEAKAYVSSDPKTYASYGIWDLIEDRQVISV
jgi:hypothetical protein